MYQSTKMTHTIGCFLTLTFIVLALANYPAAASSIPLPAATGLQIGVAARNPGTGHITGWVVENATGKAVKDALIQTGSYQTTTDGLGNFALRNLPAGQYSITVHKEGFQTYTAPTMSLLEGMTVDLEIRLQPTTQPVAPAIPTQQPAPKWKWIAGASEQFSSVQGQGNWHYLVHDFSGYHDIPWDGDDNWWQWGYPQEKEMDYVKLTLDGGHPGPGADSVRAWESPLSARIRIVGKAHKYPEVDVNGVCPYIWWTGSLGGDGVIVSIKKNQETLWEKYIDGFDHVGYSYEIFTDVVPGDLIYFSINQNRSPEFDGTFFDPGIFVTSDTVVSPAISAPAKNSDSPGSGLTFEGEVEQYLDYPGMGIEVRVFDANGSPVPGAKVHTHAYSIDFWDGTGSNGAFRRDGFTHDCVWEVTLEAENPVMLPVKFEANKLVIVNFRAKP